MKKVKKPYTFSLIGFLSIANIMWEEIFTSLQRYLMNFKINSRNNDVIIIQPTDMQTVHVVWWLICIKRKLCSYRAVLTIYLLLGIIRSIIADWLKLERFLCVNIVKLSLF